jgi:hypothetical protein
LLRARYAVIFFCAVLALVATSSRDALANPTVTNVSPNTGPAAGGTSVTITGTRFVADNPPHCFIPSPVAVSSVKFGSTNATSFTVNGPTQITATSPAGSGTVDITVTTTCLTGGAVATSATSSADRFTYTPPALTLTSTPSSTTQVGQPYSQNNVASGGTSGYAYSVSAGTLPAGTSLNTSTGTVSGTSTTAGAFSYTIKVTDSGSPAQTASNVVSGTIGIGSSSTALSSSQNPSSFTQPVTFAATVTGSSPTGTATFFDGGTQIGTGTLSGGTATFTTSSLSVGTHSITAKYNGDANNAVSTSPVLTQAVGIAADSIKLRALQVSATPIIANISGQAISSAIDNAIGVGFAGNPAPFMPNGAGFTYYFDADPNAQRDAVSGQDRLQRFLASPNGNNIRVYDRFSALGYAGMPTKAPRLAAAPPRDWLAWIDVRGTDFNRTTFGSDLKGTQVNAIAGVTRRLTPDFLVGVLGGYERFDYTSQAFNGALKGDGWTTGAYLGWRLAPHLRFDAGAAWSDIMASDAAGTASASFTGSRWLLSSGLTGTYSWQAFVLEPSARVYALWEHENNYTDSFGTLQAARNFDTGRASGGVKVSYPFGWSTNVSLAPYLGLYGDYYFSMDDAAGVGLTTVPLLQGWSARTVGGVTATLPGGAQLALGGEYGGIGSSAHIWTWRARGGVPF